MGVLHCGTRVAGKQRHIGAVDSLFFKKQANATPLARDNGRGQAYFPVTAKEVLQKMPLDFSKLHGRDDVRSRSTPRHTSGPDFWSHPTYSSTYRRHYAEPARADFSARHDDGISARLVMNSAR